MTYVHSYTAIDTFHNICPRQANERFIAKTIPYSETPAMQDGKRIHKYIEDHINGVDPLPAWMGHVVPVIESLKRYGEGATRAELKMGVTNELAACHFFDPRVYLRGSIDLLLATNDTALIVDWKTGKKRDKELQLMLYALFAFAVLPMLQNITALNFYVKEADPFGKRFTWTRAEVPEMWRTVIPLMHEIEQAIATGRFIERPGPLCKWCPVETCQHWKGQK